MNWDAAGAIGELIGAPAVVITLIYLALQIRHSNELAQATAHEQATDQWCETSSPLLDRTLAELFIRGCDSYVELDPTDRLRFATLFSNQVFQFETVFEKRKRGFVDDTFVEPYEIYFKGLLVKPGVQEYMEINASYHTSEFLSWSKVNGP